MHIREMKLEDLPVIARINVDTFRTTHGGFLSESFLNTLSYSRSEKRLKRMLADPERQSFIYVAEKDESVIGYAMAGRAKGEMEDFTGELYGIYILPEYHRMGIGRRLIQKAAAGLEQRGIGSMYVEVFKANLPARRFYEALGGQKICEHTIDLGGEQVEVIAYGWKDIRKLIRE